MALRIEEAAARHPGVSHLGGTVWAEQAIVKKVLHLSILMLKTK